LATLDIYQREGLLTRASGLAGPWAEAMGSLRDLGLIIDIRCIGLVAGLELEPRPGAPGARGYEVFVDCFQRGLLIRVTGDTIALSPPLIISEAEIGAMVETLRAAIEAVA